MGVEVVDPSPKKSARTSFPRAAKMERPPIYRVSLSQAQWLPFTLVPPEEQWLPFAWRMQGPMDVGCFREAFGQVIKTHEILRTRYWVTHDSCLQEVLPAETPSLRFCDLSTQAPDRQLHSIYDEIAPRGRSVARPDMTPLELGLYQGAKEDHILAGFIHHIAFDGVSLNIFLRDLLRCYYALSSGREPLPADGLQYGDFVSWERQWLTDDVKQQNDQEWSNRLSGAGGLGFAQSQHENAVQPVTIRRTIGEPEFAQLVEGVRLMKSTLQILAYGAFSAVLAHLGNQRKVAFGGVWHGRPVGFESVAGCFMQIRPVCVDLDGDLTFRDLECRSRAAVRMSDDMRNTITPAFARRHAFGRVLLNYTRVRERAKGSTTEPATPAAFVSAPLQTGWVTLPKSLVGYFHRDLHANIWLSSSEVGIRLTYGRGRLSLQEAERFVRGVTSLLTTGVAHPERKLKDLLEAIG